MTLETKVTKDQGCYDVEFNAPADGVKTTVTMSETEIRKLRDDIVYELKREEDRGLRVRERGEK